MSQLRPGASGARHDEQSTQLSPKRRDLPPPGDPLAGCDPSLAHFEYDYEPERYFNADQIASYRRTTRYYHVPLAVKERCDRRAGRDDLVANKLYDAREANGTLWWERCTEDQNTTVLPIECPGSGRFDALISTPADKGTFEIVYDTESQADQVEVLGLDECPLFSTAGKVATRPDGAAPLGAGGVVTEGPFSFETTGQQLRLRVTPESDGSIWNVKIIFHAAVHPTYSSDDRYGPIDADGRDLPK